MNTDPPVRHDPGDKAADRQGAWIVRKAPIGSKDLLRRLRPDGPEQRRQALAGGVALVDPSQRESRFSALSAGIDPISERRARIGDDEIAAEFRRRSQRRRCDAVQPRVIVDESRRPVLQPAFERRKRWAAQPVSDSPAQRPLVAKCGEIAQQMIPAIPER